MAVFPSHFAEIPGRMSLTAEEEARVSELMGLRDEQSAAGRRLVRVLRDAVEDGVREEVVAGVSPLSVWFWLLPEFGMALGVNRWSAVLAPVVDRMGDAVRQAAWEGTRG